MTSMIRPAVGIAIAANISPAASAAEPSASMEITMARAYWGRLLAGIDRGGHGVPQDRPPSQIGGTTGGLPAPLVGPDIAWRKMLKDPLIQFSLPAAPSTPFNDHR